MRFPKAALAVVLAAGLSACDNEPFDPCKVNPTTVSSTGQCLEADGEVCDDDPCDSDDFDGKDSHRSPKPKVTKPKPKISPARR
jgi:hypothetical protein